jgi:hypothetical protein
MARIERLARISIYVHVYFRFENFRLEIFADFFKSQLSEINKKSCMKIIKELFFFDITCIFAFVSCQPKKNKKTSDNLFTGS